MQCAWFRQDAVITICDIMYYGESMQCAWFRQDAVITIREIMQKERACSVHGSDRIPSSPPVRTGQTGRETQHAFQLCEL